MLPDGAKSYEQRHAEGRSRRKEVPRSRHARWEPDPGRPDPLVRLEASNATRVPDLVPVRYGRMMVSPRRAAQLMADDLASTPVTGYRVQACGDAYLANFGVFATPERNLVFDVNDFDETLPLIPSHRCPASVRRIRSRAVASPIAARSGIRRHVKSAYLRRVVRGKVPPRKSPTRARLQIALEAPCRLFVRELERHHE
jgi:hypothetical protein